MNIGIDIDDTISGSFETIFADSQKYDIEELGNSGEVKQYGKTADHYYIETMYPHWTQEQINTFWNKYFINTLIEAKPKLYAVEILKKLRQEGNKIILITSRSEEGKTLNVIEEYTRKWLEKNNIEYDKLVFNAQDKYIAAYENSIDLFIDDSITHCKRVSQNNIKTLLYTSITNQGVEVPNLKRVYSWIQIYNKYKQLKSL